MKKTTTVTEMLMMEDSTVQYHKEGNRTFKILWAIADKSNGYKTVINGIETKVEARKVCNESFSYYMYCYEIEI